MMDPSRTVVVLDALERRGPAIHLASPQDRRLRVLYLTEPGKSLVEQLRQRVREHEDSLAPGLSPEERKTLIRLLAKLHGS